MLCGWELCCVRIVRSNADNLSAYYEIDVCVCVHVNFMHGQHNVGSAMLLARFQELQLDTWYAKVFSMSRPVLISTWQQTLCCINTLIRITRI